MSDESLQYLRETAWRGKLRDEFGRRRFHIREGMQKILDAVSGAYDLDVADIVGERRYPRMAEARFVVYWLARRTGLSFPEIGYQLGRDHTTVMSGVKRVKEGTRSWAIAHALADKLGIREGDVVPALPRFRIAVENVA